MFFTYFINWLKKNTYKKILIFLSIIIVVPVVFFYKKLLSYVNTHLITMKNEKAPLKVVVFDLDETIGYFTEVGIFWDALENFYGHNLFPEQFHEVLDIFPQFFRPDIFKIMEFVNKKRKAKACYKIIMYTNNQGDKEWLKKISSYMDKKLGFTVFNQIVAAYKVNGKIVEKNRTSHEKSMTDLISCTNIPANVEVCFIDDLYHPLMDKDNVSYINIKPYRFSMPFEEMVRRYYNLVLKKKNKMNEIDEEDFVKIMVGFMKHYNYMVIKKSDIEEKTDKVVSKKLLAHLEDFLRPKKLNQTRKNRTRRIRTLRHNIK